MQNLGYEKYAGIFEEAKIGMLELPYLSEERLEKLGIPLGPRIRILQVGLHNFAHKQTKKIISFFPRKPRYLTTWMDRTTMFTSFSIS